MFKDKDDDPEWIYTSEQRQSGNRIPDYSVEAIFYALSSEEIIPWMHLEFKRPDGDRTFQALDQLVKTVIPTMSAEKPAVYLVVVAGFFVSFWEFDYEVHHGRNPKGIENLWGCRSLLQASPYIGDDDAPVIPNVTPDYPKDIAQICNESPGGGKEPGSTIWLEATGYLADALFDLRIPRHRTLIEEMMKYVSHRKPAAFYHPEMESDNDPDMEEGGSLLDPEDNEEGGSFLDPEDME